MVILNKIYLILIIISVLYSIYIKYLKGIKICLCTIGKKENSYAREYVEHYKKYGVNKIFIYDNNDENGEKFELVLKDYIDKGFVEIIDVRGKIDCLKQVMENCRKKNYKKFDWLIFFEMDEFIFLRNFSNLKDFLEQKIFNKCQRVQLNWFIHTDNNLIYYDKRSLKERFPVKKYIFNDKKLPGSTLVKSILKGNVDVKIKAIHELNDELIACDGFGKFVSSKGIKTTNTDHYYNYIDHYWSKSTEEFVNKLMRGDPDFGSNLKRVKNNNLLRINIYFVYNKITKEKIDYIENRTKYNLTKFRLILKNNESYYNINDYYRERYTPFKKN